MMVLYFSSKLREKWGDCYVGASKKTERLPFG